MNQLHGKTAIVTGASSGIGRAAALLFAEHGASVVLTARRQDRLASITEEIERKGGRAIAVPGDVTSEAHCRNLVETTLDRYGRLDIAFNNAGLTGSGVPLHETGTDEWHQTLQTNLTSGYLCAKYQLPAMLRQGAGSIIFTSSFVGNACGLAGMAAYGAAKAGLVGLMKGLAAETGRAGIRVNALLPGGVDTEMNPARDPETPPEIMDFVYGLHAMGRIARPAELAQAALFLASDASSFVTGAAMPVDGGVSVYRR